MPGFPIRHTRRWRLFGIAVLCAWALMIVPTTPKITSANTGLIHQMRSGVPDTLCEPTGTHCWGEVRWSGATYGTRTSIFVSNLSVPTIGYDFLTEEMWLDDFNTGAWTEIGYYSGYPTALGVLKYFYAYKAPGGSYSEHDISQVPLPDVNGYSDIKITRNGQSVNSLHLAIVSTYLYTNWSTIIINNQGGTDWGGNNIP